MYLQLIATACQLSTYTVLMMCVCIGIEETDEDQEGEGEDMTDFSVPAGLKKFGRKIKQTITHRRSSKK